MLGVSRLVTSQCALMVACVIVVSTAPARAGIQAVVGGRRFSAPTNGFPKPTRSVAHSDNSFGIYVRSRAPIRGGQGAVLDLFCSQIQPGDALPKLVDCYG